MSDYLKRLASALKKREAPMGPNAWDWQTRADNAPVGSVNAPGGFMRPIPEDKPADNFGRFLGAAGMMPGPTGDLLGPLADAYMYASDPSSRTPGNFAMSALGALPFIPSLATVYHGSPHKFDAFDLSKIGTGEGAQAYGHGLYFADNPGVAKGYASLGHVQGNVGTIKGKDIMSVYNALDKTAARTPHPAAQSYYDKMALIENLMNNQTASEVLDYARENSYSPDVIKWFESDVMPHYQGSGNLYTVDLPDEAIAKMIEWDKPINEQSPQVLEMLDKAGINTMSSALAGPMARGQESHLRKHGITGIRYLDGGSRGAGQGTSNYVVFDDKLPRILKRE